jgi:hypothetical protein
MAEMAVFRGFFEHLSTSANGVRKCDINIRDSPTGRVPRATAGFKVRFARALHTEIQKKPS